MRVRHVSVKGLFGVFDHEIPLQEEGRITIIHGMNGVGKTIILRMIWESLTEGHNALTAVPYDRFELRFDDGSLLRVLSPGTSVSTRFVRITADGLEQDTFFTGADWLKDLRAMIFVRLVTINRLLLIENVQVPNPYAYEETSQRVSFFVQECSKEIASIIRTKNAAYDEIARVLAQSFPARLLARNSGTSLSAKKLRQRLVELGEKYDKLSSLGILPATEVIRDVPDETDNSTLSTLSIYVDDTAKTLAVFDDLAARIEVLVDLVNSRFSYKRFAVRRDHGFVVTGPKGAEIPVTGLSSGEQHELIMLYELLFRTKPDTLVLIDEPEISLHLLWQQEFVDDIAKIVALTGTDVLIATHSPDIVGRHWDRTVALKGPEE